MQLWRWQICPPSHYRALRNAGLRRFPYGQRFFCCMERSPGTLDVGSRAQRGRGGVSSLSLPGGLPLAAGAGLYRPQKYIFIKEIDMKPRKLLSLFLAVLMVATLLPVSALAAEISSTGITITVPTAENQLSTSANAAPGITVDSVKWFWERQRCRVRIPQNSVLPTSWK